ncbi:MAG: hypothetical protein IPI94_14305, partial [Propionivibrio sp.]|nr:hypothetical protein [Propionivibrio sp.]
MSIVTVGIDLATWLPYGVDDNGKSALVKPKVSREHLLPLVAQLPPCVIGMGRSAPLHGCFANTATLPVTDRPQVRHASSP